MMKALKIIASLALLCPSFLLAQDSKMIEGTLTYLSEYLIEKDFHACLALEKDEFVEEFRPHITTYFEPLNYTNTSEEEIKNAYIEAIAFAEEAVVTGYGVLMEDFEECKNTIIQANKVNSEDSVVVLPKSENLLSKNYKRLLEQTNKSFPPKYPGALLVLNLDKVSSQEGIADMKSGMLLFSNDDLESIRKFYEKELPHFQILNYEKASILSERAFDPKLLESNSGIKEWLSMKSVWIESVGMDNEVPGKVKIEIHY